MTKRTNQTSLNKSVHNTAHLVCSNTSRYRHDSFMKNTHTPIHIPKKPPQPGQLELPLKPYPSDSDLFRSVKMLTLGGIRNGIYVPKGGIFSYVKTGDVNGLMEFYFSPDDTRTKLCLMNHGYYMSMRIMFSMFYEYENILPFYEAKNDLAQIVARLFGPYITLWMTPIDQIEYVIKIEAKRYQTYSKDYVAALIQMFSKPRL